MADIYGKIKLSRSNIRPTASDYVKAIFEDFHELHGDGKTGEDKAVIGGIGLLCDIPVTVIATEKGKNIEERIERNFGFANASGYGKALRLMKQAEKFGRPVITFVDTQGADCKEESERNGIARTIAETIAESTKLRTIVLSVITGEGGSGGALAFATADKVFMTENAYYSVITPESCAEILYKDVKKAPLAAEMLKPIATELLKFNVIDGIIKEPSDFSNTDEKAKFFKDVKDLIYREITSLSEIDKDKLVFARYDRFGAF